MGNLKISRVASIYMLVDLGIRILDILYRNGIKTIGQLYSVYPYMLNPNMDVFKFRGIGKKSLEAIGEVLSHYELEGGDTK